jgi:hypothetical protein
MSTPGVGTIPDAWEAEVRASALKRAEEEKARKNKPRVPCPASAKDTCMCGMDVNHDAWDAGHTPVSMWDYYGCTEEEPE